MPWVFVDGILTLAPFGEDFLREFSHSRLSRADDRVLMLVADLDVRILDTEGTVLRHLTLDPAKDNQPIR